MIIWKQIPLMECRESFDFNYRTRFNQLNWKKNKPMQGKITDYILVLIDFEDEFKLVYSPLEK